MKFSIQTIFLILFSLVLPTELWAVNKTWQSLNLEDITSMENQTHDSKKRGQFNFRFVWINNPHELEIVLDINGDPEIKKEFIHLTDEKGRHIAISHIEQKGDRVFAYTNEALDLHKSHIASINFTNKYAYFSRGALDTYFDYQGPLGAVFHSPQEAELFIWSPPASKVEVLFFSPQDQERILDIKEMLPHEKGSFKLKINAQDLGLTELHGVYYMLKVTALGQSNFALDPFAKSLAAFNNRRNKTAKAALIDPQKINVPTLPFKNKDIMKNKADYIGYELHVRDYTINPELQLSNPEYHGTFKGLMEVSGHFEDLGITHLQLLPVQAFQSVNDNDRSFQDETVFMDKINYNWGYDPHHYFSLLGLYSSDPHDPLSRIVEFKEMVNHFHQKKIGIVMDVVYNHVMSAYTFEHLAPGCYLRRNERGDISYHTGAGPSVETRTKVVRRLIVESLAYFAHEFGVDGFRFDLMGFIDHQTMREIRAAIGEDKILYGEAWEFTDLPGQEASTKQNIPEGLEIGAFNDSARDSYTGRMAGIGFVQGDTATGPVVKTGIIGGLRNYPQVYEDQTFANIDESGYNRFARSPLETINFLSIHDGFTLWDKINLSIPANEEFRKQLTKQALAMLFTSQGRLVLHGGAEMGRTKPLADNDPEKDRAHSSPEASEEYGKRFFHENSYRSPDFTNMIRWERKERFQDIFDYTQGLIQLRQKFTALHYENAESIQKGLRFIGESIRPSRPQLDSAGYESFDELDYLYIRFKNGPHNSKLYLVGEIGCQNPPSCNLPEAALEINFNEKGKAELRLSKEQITSSLFSAWADSGGLQFKLVKQAGAWESPTGYYSSMGNNTVTPESIQEGNWAEIDLSICDHHAGQVPVEHKKFIAYLIETQLEDNSTEYNKLLVIHNSDNRELILDVKQLNDFKNCDVFMDKNHAQITPIQNSDVEIEGSQIRMPGRSSTLIACKES